MAKETTFSKIDLLLTLAGFVLYLGDVGTDLWVAIDFFYKGHFLWCVLVMTVTLVSAVTLQTFSWAWYKDDEKNRQVNSEIQCSNNLECKSRCSCLCLVHIFQMGMLVRFIKALSSGYKEVFKKQETTCSDIIYAVTDLSMLRLFEAFLETAPQLVLQTFILLESDDRSYIQYGSVIMSCFSISWTTLDYYAALKRSLPAQQNLVCGFPYVIYFLYKVLTLSAKILTITLLATLHVTAVASYLCALWLIMIFCVWRQKTAFCTSKCQEIIYRTVVATILVFTFFNLKGQNTKVGMTVYYVFRIFETINMLLLCWLLKGFTKRNVYDLPIRITVGLSLVIGIVCLVLYYRLFHPQIYSERTIDEDSNNSHTEPQLHRFPDEVDGFLTGNSAVTPNNIRANNSMIDPSISNPGTRSSRITHCLTF
ncbi:XK-related protein 9 [Heterodontus francisci]|uniref:XK-related protein 9 n=1 Tax=Heterodontus francisci TaxID=7792 RepID=UPI00355BEC54